MQKFTPTEEMISAAKAVFQAMAFVETIRPIVMQYQTEILAENKWRISPEFAKPSFRAIYEDEVITDPKNSYLMSAEDFKEYSLKCKIARDKANLRVTENRFCPLLEAEHLLVQAKHALIDVMAETTKIQSQDILRSGMDKYNQYIDLTLRLLAPFVQNNMAKFAA